MSRDFLPRPFKALVFCTVLVCVFIGVKAFPVVYPSLTGTTGFAYINDTGELVTVPAALGHLLCSTPEESVDFGPADKPCSEIVFFTSSSFLTFEFLNISSNGMIQPITRTPQVASSNDGVQVRWRIPTRNDVRGEEKTSGANQLSREPTFNQTNSIDAIPSAPNDTRSGNSNPAAPSRSASPSPEVLSSPPPVNETIDVAGNETEESGYPTRSAPISDSTRNATEVPEEEPTTEEASISPSPSRAIEEASIAPSPSRSPINRTGRVRPEVEAESTTAPSSVESPSSHESPAEAPTSVSILAGMVLASASLEAEISPITSPVESPESSQSEVALIPTSTESAIIPELSSFASIPEPSKSSPSTSLEATSARDSEPGSFEAGATLARFAPASVPETSNDDAFVPFLESFSGLEPATDRAIDAELFALGSEPSMDESEELEQHGTEAASPSDYAPEQRSTDDAAFIYLIDEDESGNTPARRSRRESGRRVRPVGSNGTTFERDSDLLIISTADASVESETEVEDTEQAEDRSLRRLLQDPPPAGDSTTDQAIDAAVLQANETSGFLDPTGAPRNDLNFVLQLEARNLPEQTLFTLEFTFGDGVSRSLMIYFDSSPVSADIEEQSNPNEDPNRRREDYVYRVSFSSRMVSLPSEESMSCPRVTGPLNALSSAQFDPTQNSLTPNDLTALIRASEGLSSCNERLEQLDPASIVSIDGVNEVVAVDDEQINVDELRQGGRLVGSVVTVNFSTDKDRKKRVTFNVGGEAGVSLYGVPVNQEARQYRVGINSGKIRDAEHVGEVCGTTATAVMGAAIGASFLVNIGMPFLSFFNLGSVDPVGHSSPLSSAVDLIQFGQRMYLMSKLAAPNLPENFIAFAQRLHWTMLDFDLPWKEDSEDDDDSEHVQLSTRKLLNNNTHKEEDGGTGDGRSKKGSGKDGENESVYGDFQQAYFWAAVSFVGMVILHLLLLVVFLANERDVPGFLRLPRLELYLFQAILAALVGGPANLFAGTTIQIIVGIVLVVTCVLPLFYWHIHILRKYVLTEGREERNIVYVLKPVVIPIPSERNHDQQLPNVASRRQTPKENIKGEGDTSWFETYVWAVLFGGLYRRGEWTWKDDKAKRVVSRFGPIFEDSRGVPMYERPKDGAQDEGSDKSKAETNRFAEVAEEHRYSVDVPWSSFCLRTSDKLLSLGKTVFVAALLMGEDHAERDYQAFLILIVSCAYVVYLRVYRPHSIRWKLALAMLSTCVEIVLYVLVIAAVYTSKSQETVFRIDVGTAMMVIVNFGEALLILDVVMSCFDILKEALAEINGKVEKATIRTEDRHLTEEAFEEQFWRDPREAVRSKIVVPLVETVRSRTSGRGSKHESSTGQNPPTET